MRFCKSCKKVMVKDAASGSVTFRCPVCGDEVEGDEWDLKIFGDALVSGETTEGLDRYLAISSRDRTVQRVKRLCLGCGLDYMAQIRTGSSEMIYFTCKCGRVITGEEALKEKSREEDRKERKEELKKDGAA